MLNVKNLFTLCSRDTLVTDIFEKAVPQVEASLAGYSDDIRHTARLHTCEEAFIEAAQGRATGTMSNTSSLDIKASSKVIVNSSGWTGADFDGFKKPQVAVELIATPQR